MAVFPVLPKGVTRAAYLRALQHPYVKTIRVSVLTKDGEVVEDVSDAFLDGNVTVDSGAEVSRACTVQLLDPRRRWGVTADSYQGEELHLARQLRVLWCIDSPLLPVRVSVPVFTGPVTRLQREGPIVQVECQGKEVYGLVPTRRSFSRRYGANKTATLRDLLVTRMGESRHRLGGIPRLGGEFTSGGKLHDVNANAFVCGPKDKAWVKAKTLSGGRQLLYGGDGAPYLRRYPSSPVFVFYADREDATVTSPVTVSGDLQQIKNVVQATGQSKAKKVKKGNDTDAKKDKDDDGKEEPKWKIIPPKPIRTSVTLPRRSPVSAYELGPNNAPMWLLAEISNNKARGQKALRKVALDALQDTLRHDLSFSAVPIPHLEPGDLIRVVTDWESSTSRVRTFDLPLGEGDMSIGYADPWALRPVRKGGGGKGGGKGNGGKNNGGGGKGGGGKLQEA